LALTDIAGILSRKFVVGFFLPGFFGCLALKLLVADRAVPRGLREAGGGTKILILGGVALLLGLFLWGVHYSLIRLLEGYWLIAPTLPDRDQALGNPDSRWRRSRLLSPVRGLLVLVRGGVRAPFRLADWARRRFGTWKRQRWVRVRAKLLEARAQPTPSEERTRAARHLSARFPPRDDLVLPTELGNVIRAFETHPRERYGLDGIAIWPSIVTMLTDSELAEIEEKTTDIAFWLNSLAVVVVAGALLFAERLWHQPGRALETAAIEVAIAAAVVAMAAWMYRQLIGAAIRWGEPVRAAFDVHRLELYDRLGVRRPHTKDEDRSAGDATNRLLAFADPLPLGWRADPSHEGQHQDQGRERRLALAVSVIAVGIAVIGNLPALKRSTRPPGAS
jgi:hypothetical protein